MAIVIGGIRIYPVKGLDPVPVPEARVLAGGALEMDRRWALVDARGRFVNGKNYAEVHRVRAGFDLARGEIQLEGRAWSLEREAEDVARWFSARLGSAVTLREDRAGGFPDDTDSPGPTLVSGASLDAVAHCFDLDLNAARLRFRANIEVEGLAAFGEDAWYGRGVRMGKTVRLQAVNPCQRCVVPSRDARTGEPTPGFQKRFAEWRARTVPEELPARALFTHFYRLAVNTRQAGEAGVIRTGDEIHAE